MYLQVGLGVILGDENVEVQQMWPIGTADIMVQVGKTTSTLLNLVVSF